MYELNVGGKMLHRKFAIHNGSQAEPGNFGQLYLSTHPELARCIVAAKSSIGELQAMTFPELKIDPKHKAHDINLLYACAEDWLKPKIASVCHLCLQLSFAADLLEKQGEIKQEQRETILRSVGWSIRESLTDKNIGQLPALGSFLSLNNKDVFKRVVVSIDDEIDVSGNKIIKDEYMVLKRLIWIDKILISLTK